MIQFLSFGKYRILKQKVYCAHTWVVGVSSASNHGPIKDKTRKELEIERCMKWHMAIY
jgi:hypothetical protein